MSYIEERSPMWRDLPIGLISPSTASATLIPVVALAELNTEAAPFPRENSTEASKNTTSGSAMKNQCHEAATARRTGPGSSPVAARIARAIGRRIAQYIATL